MDFGANIEDFNFNFGENFYDEIDIKNFEFDPETNIFSYPCPCGDIFEISMDELRDGEEVARCRSCSLILRILYDEDDIDKYGNKK